MANQPEHDFAPSWLKIPHNNQIPHHHSDDHHRIPGKHPFHQDARSRRPPHNGYHGYPPGPFSRGGSGPHRNDERRHYPSRQHSADDLMSMGGNGRLPPFNRNSPGMFSPPPHSFTEAFFPNPSQYRGRFGPGTQEGYNGGGRAQTRARHHSGGRQRYPSGGSMGSKDRTSHSESRKESLYPRTSHSEDRSKPGGSEHSGGMRTKKETAPSGAGDRGKKDVGGEKDSSALSSHDFPSLSGDRDQKKDTTKTLKPAGAWDNRPGTTKVTKVAGRNYKLIQKPTPLKDASTAGGGGKDGVAPSSSPKGLSPRSGPAPAATGSLKLSSQTSTGPPSQPHTRGIIPVKSTNGGLMLKVTTSTKVTPRQQGAKEPTTRKEKLAPAPPKEKLPKDKPAVAPNSNGNSNNTAPSIVVPPATKPNNVSQPIDVPSSRGVLSRVKRGQKNTFIRELRRSSTTDVQTNGSGGGLDNEDYNSNNRASRVNGDMEKNTKNLQDMSINSVEITTSLENGYLDANESWDDTSTVKLSSSQEAEQRLLREMGWHEHSDNEEGYAPITEDERKEFKLRSQQLMRNGFTRPELIISNSLPVNTLPPPVVDEDNFSCSSLSDTSDDEDY